MSIQSIRGGPGAPPTLPSLNIEPGKNTSGSGVQASTAAQSEQSGSPQATQQKPSADQLNSAVDSMNEFVVGLNSSLKFSVDDNTGQTVVKVIDDETNEVIKQIPSEEMLAIASAVDKLKGLLVQQKA
jgi:flagellar protein FlaG